MYKWLFITILWAEHSIAELHGKTEFARHSTTIKYLSLL